MADYRDWLQKGLSKPGVEVAAVARALGKHHSSVYKLINGERKFHIDELSKIARVIGEPIPIDAEAFAPTRSFSYRKHFILDCSGIISAGCFAVPKKSGAADLAVVFRDAKFPKAQHMVFGVTGKILESKRIFEGDRLFCLDFEGAGGVQAITDGTPIIVERTRRGKRERAIKIARLSDVSAATEPEIGFVVSGTLHNAINGTSKRTTDAIKVVAVVRSAWRTLP